MLFTFATMTTDNETMEKKFKYKISKYGAPELVEIIEETEHFIKIVGHKSKDKKITDYQCFFDTLDAAKAWRLSLVFGKIERAESMLDDAKKEHLKLLKEMGAWK
jgi:hypothetical protein